MDSLESEVNFLVNLATMGAKFIDELSPEDEQSDLEGIKKAKTKLLEQQELLKVLKPIMKVIIDGDTPLIKNPDLVLINEWIYPSKGYNNLVG